MPAFHSSQMIIFVLNLKTKPKQQNTFEHRNEAVEL